MKDISESIKHAISQDVLWSVSDFYILIEEINKSTRFTVSHWENEEFWGTIIDNKNIIQGYIWKRYPLIIAIDEFISTNKYLFHQHDFIELVTVSKLDKPELSINDLTIKQVLGLTIDDNWLSAEDIWFNTNDN